MPDLFSKHKTIVYVTAGVLVAIGVWYVFSGNSGESSALLSSQNIAEAANPVEKDLLQTLLQLRAVSLSGTILTDPGFMALKDFGTQIIPEQVGRQNPFAPISGGAQTAPAAPASKQKTSARAEELFTPR